MKKKLSPMVILASAEFIAVAILSVVFKVKIYDALPLLISAVVMFMQTRVNRYAFLIGGINSIIYALAYFYMKLYGLAISTFLLSFPLQIITFINWNKNTHKGTTEIKCFTFKGRVLLFVGMAAVWAVLYVVFSALGSAYLILDNTVTVIGVVATIICMLRYSEYAVLQFITSVVNVILFAVMTADDISKIIWLIYSVYCVICAAVIFSKTHKGIRSEE